MVETNYYSQAKYIALKSALGSARAGNKEDVEFYLHFAESTSSQLGIPLAESVRRRIYTEYNTAHEKVLWTQQKDRGLKDALQHAVDGDRVQMGTALNTAREYSNRLGEYFPEEEERNIWHAYITGRLAVNDFHSLRKILLEAGKKAIENAHDRIEIMVNMFPIGEAMRQLESLERYEKRFRLPIRITRN